MWAGFQHKHSVVSELMCQNTQCLLQRTQQAMERKVSLGEDLTHILREFNNALEDFSKGPCESNELLRQLKEQLTSYDRGLSDSSTSSSEGSSLNTSEENLNQSMASARQHPNAKLGDTRELENYIADLDKVLDDL
ncbi:regulator of cell cycle RGCC [Xenopus laevis]|uniref:Regulator of cell cycle RGCC n=2 Tax=Xenopus laevis TaxID=8355 RepID=A0A8J0TI11_XENLA|nr:regulator of cell cycle RGCC [Xenopus laevis]